MKKVICCILILGVSSLVFSQETEVIKKTKVYLKPGVEKTIIGELLPGVTVTKLKKDRTGQYIKATIEFYIPMESLLEGEAEALTRTAIDKALAGDMMALRICFDRLYPPQKSRNIQIDLPPIMSR